MDGDVVFVDFVCGFGGGCMVLFVLFMYMFMYFWFEIELWLSDLVDGGGLLL